ncbi:hypothetical protein ACE1CD_37195 [Aerosakkonema sp. BLCC-F183]|uniref:hypothetical protein n=1 Tax=Aerosakkonema sp. BLCC-F183 TaxID=3342834 RepID=UPI0035B6F7F3
MKTKSLALAGFGIFTSVTLGVIPAQIALGQSQADYYRSLCEKAPVNSFAAMLISRGGVDCTRYGMSPQMNQAIQAEQSRNNAMLNCAAYGGNWRNDLGMCMPKTQYECDRRQGVYWNTQYNECFPTKQ